MIEHRFQTNVTVKNQIIIYSVIVFNKLFVILHPVLYGFKEFIESWILLEKFKVNL
jgi:hypothetical protein